VLAGTRATATMPNLRPPLGPVSATHLRFLKMYNCMGSEPLKIMQAKLNLAVINRAVLDFQ